MRIVLSRKGFDSKAGGCPSPLIDGRPVSLPIPANGSPTGHCFADLTGPLADMVFDLSRQKIARDAPCHLDPDIDACRLPARPEGWRGCLGQIGSAQGHLRNAGIGQGDLFLFWGSFRSATRDGAGHWRHIGPTEHRIFGWLQVDEILRPGPNGSSVLETHPWLSDHPHARPGWTSANTLYVASSDIRLAGRTLPVPGWGVFPWGHRLSLAGAMPSRWLVPRWLCPPPLGCGMTYHRNATRWDLATTTVKTVAQGQEFIADIGENPDAMNWLGALLLQQDVDRCGSSRDQA